MTSYFNPNATTGDFKPGDRVLYVPEKLDGIVTSTHIYDINISVCYKVGAYSEPTDPRHLKFMGRDKQCST